MRIRMLIGPVAAAIAIAGCEKKERAEPAGGNTATPLVMTTFYPTEYMARRIGGDLVEVRCPVPEDADAIFWQPSREEVEAYAAADLIVINGAEFEKWVATVSLPESRVVDTAAGFEDDFVTFETTTHAHGPGGEHTHEGVDGHTWVDPQNAIAQARTIQEAMVARWAAHETAFRVNGAALASDLSQLDARFEAIAPMLEGAQLLASHPAYNYVAKRYGWSIGNFELDPGEPIDPEALGVIRGQLDGDARVRVMLWESAPVEAAKAALAETGVVSVEFSPCELLGEAERAAGEDYLSIMNANLDRLGGALGVGGGG
jgi:zinc transport system substrate-binding protein